MFNVSYFPIDYIRTATASLLLDTGAVFARSDPLFELTSGRQSPVYVDCRRLISFPRARNMVVNFAASLISEKIGVENIDAIAGGETAGIPYAAWLADRFMLPMLYVRKQPKRFGRTASIEGVVKEGDHVLLVEDLCTDGGSKLAFCEALRSAGAVVCHVVVVFNYGIFPTTQEEFRDAGLVLHGLTTWREVLKQCRESQSFDETTLEVAEKFLGILPGSIDEEV